jgi:hypothetical protein
MKWLNMLVSALFVAVLCMLAVPGASAVQAQRPTLATSELDRYS